MPLSTARDTAASTDGRTVEHRILGVDMQVNERIHGCPLRSCWFEGVPTLSSSGGQEGTDSPRTRRVESTA